jgi:hypothetical protein
VVTSANVDGSVDSVKGRFNTFDQVRDFSISSVDLDRAALRRKGAVAVH